MIQFSVKQWSAWAPGLVDQDAWRAWARAPWRPTGDETPALAEVPAMQRRRIERLGRMAIQTAWWCQQAHSDSIPLVFASRHGDVARSMELLGALTDGEPLSPTTFGLSVHNAIAALYSIIRGQHGNYLAVAGGKATVETACVEAASLLSEGATEVLLVVYDAPLPDMYRGFADEPDAGFAWCWRLGPEDGSRDSLTLGWQQAAGGMDEPGQLPHALDVLRFLIAGEPQLRMIEDDVQWQWQRHA